MPHGWRVLIMLFLLFVGGVAWISLHRPPPVTPRLPVEQAAPKDAAGKTPPTPAPAGEREPDGEPPPPQPEPMVESLGNGGFRVGAIDFNRLEKTITIPASVNMREGPVEYVLVMKHGKVHESVFVTDADARDIQVAALLLGISPQPDLGPENAPAVVKNQGRVSCRVEWDRNGPPARVPLHELVSISNPSSGALQGTLTGAGWLYNGSRIEPDGAFAATRSGSIISIIRDSEALINNPGASRDNDDIHTPNAAKLPKLQHPVRIVLKVE